MRYWKKSIEYAACGGCRRPGVPCGAVYGDVSGAAGSEEKEIREFGGASKLQAKRIEALWQEVMQAYLACTPDGTLIRAENSSHYIHLTDSELICGLL